MLLILFCSFSYAQDYEEDEDDENLPYVEILEINDFQALGRLAKKEGKVIFIEMSASYCGYCKTLEEFIIKPMLRSGDYEDFVLIRKMDIDSRYTIKDFDGSKTSPASFAYQRDVSLTPTLLFLDDQGNEISERILGVNTLELFGAYVEEGLQQGYRKIKNR
jgi:thioredoxin-related protein